MEAELKKAIELIMTIGQRNLVNQGHKNTGALLASMKITVDKASAELYGAEYGLAQETGIQASRHPFKGGKGDSSEYIDAIAEWVRNKGIEDDFVKSKGIAFAIAKRQSGRGLNNGTATGMHSTDGRFDSTKQGWLSSAIKETSTEVEEIISDGAMKAIDLIITNAIKEANRNLGK
jgi:hypothetical protein